MKKSVFAAVLCAAIITAAAFSGCKKDNGSGQNAEISETVSENSQSENAVSESNITESENMEDIVVETRPLENGDDYAINKINPRSPEDELPGGYSLAVYSETENDQQLKFYANGKSKILIQAYNYKEDLLELAVWADQACAITKINNMLSACDTNFSEPENITCFGFDSIKYDYEIIQYKFNTTEDGKEEKDPVGRYLGIAYFFYSEQDAYAIMFDTADSDWEEQSANFEAFLNDLEVTKTEY